MHQRPQGHQCKLIKSKLIQKMLIYFRNPLVILPDCNILWMPCHAYSSILWHTHVSHHQILTFSQAHAKIQKQIQVLVSPYLAAIENNLAAEKGYVKKGILFSALKCFFLIEAPEKKSSGGPDNSGNEDTNQKLIAHTIDL